MDITVERIYEWFSRVEETLGHRTDKIIVRWDEDSSSGKLRNRAVLTPDASQRGGDQGEFAIVKKPGGAFEISGEGGRLATSVLGFLRQSPLAANDTLIVKSQVPTSGGKLFADPISAVGQEGYELVQRWLDRTEGRRLPATPEVLERFGLAEPTTIRARLVRYGPTEGIGGVVSAFAAPPVTRYLFNIDPIRNPGGFHAVNLGLLHFLNATTSGLGDVVFQSRNKTSAMRAGTEVFTSPSLARTYLRISKHRLAQLGGLTEGAALAPLGYVVGEGVTGLVTDNPQARAIGGGILAFGGLTGLKIWKGERWIQNLTKTTVGRAVPLAGTVLLSKDLLAAGYETIARSDLSDRDAALREEVIHELPWTDRQFCHLSSALFMSGIGTPLGVPGVSVCERLIAAGMDIRDGGGRHERFKITRAEAKRFLQRITIPGSGFSK